MSPPSISESFSLAVWDRREHLAGDASARRYSRLWADGHTAILVEYPGAIRPQLGRDLEVLGWCRDLGLRVPGSLAVDLARGRAILEDLGADDAETILAATPAEKRRSLLEGALEPLEILAGVDPAGLPGWNPPLDRDRMRWELAGFELWYIRHYRGRSPSTAIRGWLDHLAAQVGDHPTRVCHRDFHLNNLLIRAPSEIGVIDIQDILLGPDTYDVVSLVYERAAHRLLSTKDQQALLASWAERTQPPSGWRRRAELVRIQRGLKVLGSFGRFVVAGQTRYRPWLDELAASLREALQSAAAPPSVTALLVD